ncbi:hypothetical protein C8Q70DRAFT_1091432 [Cubamyces menziesii]|nr:hypothetical protein C8Q70DRAFT_1091432 [Cubamyces menziesii]
MRFALTRRVTHIWKADAINGKAMGPGFFFATTPSALGSDDSTKEKVGCWMYAAGSRAIIDERTDWTTIEVSVACETEHADDAEAVDGRWTGLIDSITSFSSLVFRYQLVTHHFTILFLGDCARLAMTDRAGIIYTSHINYKANPAKLGRVFWRLSRATPEARGHDPSAVRILRGSPEYDAMVTWKTKTLPAGDHARELFVDTLDEDYPWYRLAVHHEDNTTNFLVAKPTYAALGLVGRSTRGFVAHNVSDPSQPFVYLKDCWRVKCGHTKREGDVLAYLNSKRVKNIPTLLYHGDVLGHKTVTQEMWQLFDEESERECPIEEYWHYRVVVKEVGRPIYEFSNGKQLVKILSDCVLAHKEAHKKAKVIHRDVSVGNMIMIPVDKSPQGTPIYRGLLTDWELSKDIHAYDLKPRNVNRTGTWQYLSVNASNRRTEHIDVADDLESFLYVLIWCAIRYLPHDCPDVGHFMYSFFDHGETTNHKEYTCGLLKRLAISDGYLMTNTQRPITFLCEPLHTSVDKPMARVGSAPAHLPPILPSDALLTSKSSPLPPPTAAPLAPIESPSLAPDIPQEQKHPIHHIITVLLGRFKRYYKAQAFYSMAPVKPKQIAVKSDSDGTAYDLALFDSDSDSDSDTHSGWDLSDDRSLASERKRKKISKKANSHRVFGSLLVDFIRDENVGWPMNDRLADQLEPKH